MVGKEILGYRVDEKIGSGGFGTVYKVSKTNAAGTYVRALKHITLPTKKQYASVLNSMGGDYAKADDYFAGALKDIVNEIKILSTLSESGVTNIVRYYENDIIETNSPKTYDIYILMEYLTPFTDYMEDRALTVKDVIGLGKDMLTALNSCHEKNIIHRDIKDDNIFVSPDGVYKLGDFGVSKALKDKSRAESVKGTPNFIAPEVYLGKEKYDNTVDLYSLGIVLYKLLNKSRNPFLPVFPAPYSTDDEDAAFEARMAGKIPELPVGAQNELGKAVLKAIMPRDQRYDSAAEFLAALNEAEKTLSAEELNATVCEVVNFTAGGAKEVTQGRSVSSQATLAMDGITKEEESDHQDRHLFDTFAAPSYKEEAPAAQTPKAAPQPEPQQPKPQQPPKAQPTPKKEEPDYSGYQNVQSEYSQRNERIENQMNQSPVAKRNNKLFKFYAIGWALALALFNVISFVTPLFRDAEGYSLAFWFAYGLITLCFAGQLVCAYLGFKADTAKRTFYNISLIKTSTAGLVASFIVGGVCMLITSLAYWIGIIACCIVLVVNVIAVLRAKAAIDIVDEVDQKIQAQTFFIRSLTVDAESLMTRAPAGEYKDACKKVYEAVRYSDTMSHPSLAAAEGQITIRFNAFSAAVANGDIDATRSICEELLVLIADRNKKCKLLK